MLTALDCFVPIWGVGWSNCKDGKEQTRKKGENSAKEQNNIHPLPRMSGHRDSCRGRWARKANYFVVWGLEEHMISCCLHFELCVNKMVLKTRFVFADVSVQAEVHRSPQGVDEDPWGAGELFHWAPFPCGTSGERRGIISYTLTTSSLCLLFCWRVYLDLNSPQPHSHSLCCRSRWCHWSHFLSLQLMDIWHNSWVKLMDQASLTPEMSYTFLPEPL